ncbi:MAG: hypothetical protein NC218_05770 [Acetobacter sp.]|nr:hypothetical protein [Acetobacter sp.]
MIGTILLITIIVFVIYNAERMPQLMSKLKDEVPHIVDAGKKASKELKEKAQAAQEKVAAKKQSKKDKENQ